jgi:chromosome segregation ATPase
MKYKGMFGFGTSSEPTPAPIPTGTGGPGLTAKIGKLTETMKSSRGKVESHKQNVARLKTIVAKLTGSYQSSVEVIVDLSHILKGYQSFLVELESYFKSVNENFTSQLKDMKDIEDSTANALSNVRTNLTKEVEFVKKLAEEVAVPNLKGNMDKLDSQLVEMQTLMGPSAQQQKTVMGGGASKNVHMRRKLKVRIRALTRRLNKVGRK